MRIPVFFSGGTATDAYLAEFDLHVPDSAYTVRFSLPAAIFGHAMGCACCAPRGPVAAALAQMFIARATGAAPFFDRIVVLASAAGEKAVIQAIATDVLATARFSLAAPGR